MAPVYPSTDAHTHPERLHARMNEELWVAASVEAGVRRWVLAAADPAQWPELQTCAQRLARTPGCGAALCLGVHPWWVDGLEPQAIAERIESLAEHPDIDGIGETGLDFARARGDAARNTQRMAFQWHLELAHHRNLPVVLHIVRAMGNALAMVAALDLPPAGGMVHAWSGAPEMVQPALDLGLHLSIGPAVLSVERVRASVPAIPADRLLIETDCPDGRLPEREFSQPADLLTVAAAVAELRGESTQAVLEQTSRNAADLFPILEVPDGPA